MSSLLDQVLGPPLAAAGMLLLAGGWTKLRAPGRLRSLLAEVGLPLPGRLIRGFAVGEMSVGVACIVDPMPLALALMAAMFGGFAVFVALLLMKPGGSRVRSCGCLGTRDAAPTWAHVATDGLIALAAIAAAATHPASLLRTANQMGVPGVVLVGATIALAYLAYLLLTYFPDAWHSYGGSSVRRGSTVAAREGAQEVVAHG